MAGTLASWNDGPAKRAIVEFVERVTKEDGTDYVPPAERIATLDNAVEYGITLVSMRSDWREVFVPLRESIEDEVPPSAEAELTHPA